MSYSHFYMLSSLIFLLLLSRSCAKPEGNHSKRDTSDSFDVNISAGYGVGIGQSSSVLPKSTTTVTHSTNHLQQILTDEAILRNRQPRVIVDQFPTIEADSGSFKPQQSRPRDTRRNPAQAKNVMNMKEIQNVLHNLDDGSEYSKIVQVVKVPAIYEIHLEKSQKLENKKPAEEVNRHPEIKPETHNHNHGFPKVMMGPILKHHLAYNTNNPGSKRATMYSNQPSSAQYGASKYSRDYSGNNQHKKLFQRPSMKAQSFNHGIPAAVRHFDHPATTSKSHNYREFSVSQPSYASPTIGHHRPEESSHYHNSDYFTALRPRVGQKPSNSHEQVTASQSSYDTSSTIRHHSPTVDSSHYYNTASHLNMRQNNPSKSHDYEHFIASQPSYGASSTEEHHSSSDYQNSYPQLKVGLGNYPIKNSSPNNYKHFNALQPSYDVSAESGHYSPMENFNHQNSNHFTSPQLTVGQNTPSRTSNSHSYEQFSASQSSYDASPTIDYHNSPENEFTPSESVPTYFSSPNQNFRQPSSSVNSHNSYSTLTSSIPFDSKVSPDPNEVQDVHRNNLREDYIYGRQIERVSSPDEINITVQPGTTMVTFPRGELLADRSFKGPTGRCDKHDELHRRVDVLHSKKNRALRPTGIAKKLFSGRRGGDSVKYYIVINEKFHDEDDKR